MILFDGLGLLVLGVLFVIFVLETVLIEVEHWGWATLTLIVTAVAAHFLHVFRINEFVAANGWHTLWYVLAYVGVGVAWSFVKWFSYLRQYRDMFREQKETFCKGRNLDASKPVPEDQMQAFKDHLANRLSSSDWKTRNEILSLSRPRAANNKRRITAWMAYWPCSAIGTLLNDPVRRVFNWLFNHFKALYQKMADWVFRNEAELK